MRCTHAVSPFPRSSRVAANCPDRTFRLHSDRNFTATIRGRDCGPDIINKCPNMHSVYLCTYVQPGGMWNRTSLSSM